MLNQEVLHPILVRLISGPILPFILFLLALLVAEAMVRAFPLVTKTLAQVEGGRARSIDGLRGFLAFGVFVHHTAITWGFLHTGLWELPPSRLAVHLGQSSVALFFMITAFLFWGRVLARGPNIDWAGFFVSRLFRLYPAYLVMFGLLVATVIFLPSDLPAPSPGETTKAVIKWLTFTALGAPNLHGVRNTRLMVAGVTWSLPYEWMFYIALPVFAFVFRAGQNRWPALLSALALVVILPILGWNPRRAIPICASFLGGIVAAHWVRLPVLIAIGRTRAAAIAAIIALFSVFAFCRTAYEWPATVGLSVFFVVVASGNPLGGVLHWPSALWLGDISYSIYLLHGLVLSTIFWHLIPRAVALDPRAFLLLSSLAGMAVVLLASVIFLAIERPAITAGKATYAAMRLRWLYRESNS